MFQRKFVRFLLIALVLSIFGCQRTVVENKQTVAPQTLRDVPALRLNFRLEADVPTPTVVDETAQSQERNAAVQNDFDQHRPQEILDKTVTSPDKQKVLAVYHKVEDSPGDYRLDMYSADGRLLQKVTHGGMAIHYPETIVWSPDSGSVAFMAKTRVGQTNDLPPETAPNQPDKNAETAINSETNAPAEIAANNSNTNVPSSNPAASELPKTVLTFRTEQIYLADANGNDVKPLTQNEGLIYFYFTWSPDSSMLVSLATTFQEWNFLQYQADGKGELFIPMGRPRLVEKNGRERRLDDNLTAVHPVWSPDSAKVADAFGTQIRIYDAIGNAPTQAAIPLRNQLLIASKTYEENLPNQQPNENINSNAGNQPTTNANAHANQSANAASEQPSGALPDENSLSSFNPIVNLEWTQDNILYFQTGYVKEYKNPVENRRSFLRWHRLVFSPQAVALQ